MKMKTKKMKKAVILDIIKRCLLVLSTLTLPLSAVFSQTPQKMSHQSIVRDADNNLVKNTTVGMQISILQGSVTGTAVYIERHSPTTNTFGIIALEIGTGIIVFGDLASIDWTNGPYFIKTETDLSGGENYSITGTSQLLSVPYALYGKTAGSVTITTINAIKETIYNELLDAGMSGVVKDSDGNAYKTIKIGSQVWMAENLRTTTYNDGTPITKLADSVAWRETNYIGAYCWYDNDSATYAETYGALYKWYTVEINNLCPAGWHVPSDVEWTILTDYLGGTDIAGGKLKETGITHWNSPNTGATNESGFTALPGGYRGNSGGFVYIGRRGYWWSSTEYSIAQVYTRYLDYFSSNIFRNDYFSKPSGSSVRCLRDD
jgi:uncharacterized protein (TIGR02145 family)